MAFTALIKVLEIPALHSMFNNVSRLAESNAFLRSMKATYSFPPGLDKYFCVMTYNVKTRSVVEDPFLKLACVSAILRDRQTERYRDRETETEKQTDRETETDTEKRRVGRLGRGE